MPFGARSIFGPIVESIAWYTWAEVPPTETWFPAIRTPITIALFKPPGTTVAGTFDHVTDWEVDVGATDAKEVPDPLLFDLYVSLFVSQAIQQLYP
jgi:hypothetical protein